MPVSASINALGSKPPTASPAQQVLTDVRMAIAQFKENNPFVLINIEDDDSPMADVALTFRLIIGMPLLCQCTPVDLHFLHLRYRSYLT
ncbi:hypothetical protein ACLKA6_012779 [Drosophila palustris]